MVETVLSRKLVILALVAAGVAAAIHISRLPRTEGGPPDAPPAFVECGEKAGITFHMNFLPWEQGVLPFKINLYDHGCGVAVADFDGDGYDDIFLANQLGPCSLFRNNRDGTFTDVAVKAGVALGDRVCVAAAWGDFDNDGHPDLYVTSTRGGNVLYRNKGDGTFENVTEKARVGLVAHSQSAVFFDFDGDGHPDLFVTNTARWTFDKPKGALFHPGVASIWELANSPVEMNVLYRNNGDGTFTDVTAKAGVSGKGWGGDVAVADFDGDGRPDIFLTNMFGSSQLYHNKGDGTFSDVTRAVFPRTSFGAIGCRAFDFDNDGRLDLFVTDMHSDMWLRNSLDPRELPSGMTSKKYTKIMGPAYEKAPFGSQDESRLEKVFQVKYDTVLFGNTLFKQGKTGKYEEMSESAGMETWWPWGIATGDFDNDGFEDAFIPSGMGFPFFHWPNALMMNNGNGTFTDRAARAGIEPPPGGPYLDRLIAGKAAARSSRAAAVGDFRREGRLDIIVNNFNDRAFLFRNEHAKRDYVQFRLTGAMRKGDKDGRTGKKSSRDAVGALVYLRFGKETMVRQVNPAGGYLTQSSPVLHFGLGGRGKPDSAEIVWPSGRRETIASPAINTLHLRSEPTGAVP